MNQGKSKCEILKGIRIQIAQENEIPLEVEECFYEGDCRGTCPRCEAELHYLEQKISEKNRIGKRAMVAGISLGIITSLSSCHNQNQPSGENFRQTDTIATITIQKDTIPNLIPPPEIITNETRLSGIIAYPIIKELSGVDEALPIVDTIPIDTTKDYREVPTMQN